MSQKLKFNCRTFHAGQRVRSANDLVKEGKVVGEAPGFRGLTCYEILWNDGKKQKVGASELVAIEGCDDEY